METFDSSLERFIPSADLEHLDGGAGRDRTDDLKLAKLALSQLSYGPVSGARDQGSGDQDSLTDRLIPVSW